MKYFLRRRISMVWYITYIVWNFILFLIMFLDKYKAEHQSWRISERFFMISAFFMGGVGVFLGMYCFRHKTKHWKFKLLVPIAIVLNLTVLYFLPK